AEGLTPGDATAVDVFLVPLGDDAKTYQVALSAELRKAGVRVDLAYGGKGLKGAMKAADRSGARLAVIIGDRDLEAQKAQLKDLASGEQIAVPLDGLVAAVKEKLT